MGRHEFSASTKDLVAKRAAFICSNPDCKAFTVSPSDADESKLIYIGRVAHMSAASPGGPRFDASLSLEQRASSENAIFLCPSCADMIDKNGGADHPIKLLLLWKEQHTAWVRSNLNKRADSHDELQAMPDVEFVFQDGTNQAQFKLKRCVTDGQFDKRDELESRVIRLDFAITNLGETPATDVDGWIAFPKDVAVFDQSSMRAYWESYPLDLFGDPDDFAKKLFGKDDRAASEKLASAFIDTMQFSIFDDQVALDLGAPLPQPVPGGITPAISGSEVTFHVKRLKHNTVRFLEPIYTFFRESKERECIDVSFRLNVSELPNDLEGTVIINPPEHDSDRT